MKFNNKTKISYTLLRIANELLEIEKKTRNYGTDQQLFEAEIHMIKAIKENEGIHVTGLADILGVTKGAVSQIIMRLERKGMIIKEKDIKNQSRLVLKLTPKGEIAHINHERFHLEFDDFVNEILGDATEDNIIFLKSFLTSIESNIVDFEGEKDR
ncbi:MarR family transcriptional regulator [Clostridium sp. MB40-C1]|uniref:MarR family winged helix-turn-helix transcriptional regulator n=1 Tax=Clostridium sp. MB40-C1 TaxID=3070996 RepID=UPI0027E04CE9|nr:MarR family transcriptional regulator [Clostridium sp. MB40-C1]WMJ81560.1 MarR family transcriptional regulator [Clostridium sp. MB40-C1]